MKSKSEECRNCPLYTRPGPVKSYFTGDKVDVVFVFIAPGYNAFRGECLHDPLKSKVEEVGLTSYGVVDAWKCVLDGSLSDTSNGERHIYTHCFEWLRKELTTHQPKMLVTIGAAAMEALTFRSYSAYRYPGRYGGAERVGDFLMMPMIYPSKAKKYPEAWDEGFNKLREFLEVSNETRVCSDNKRQNTPGDGI